MVSETRYLKTRIGVNYVRKILKMFASSDKHSISENSLENLDFKYLNWLLKRVRYGDYFYHRSWKLTNTIF